MEQTIPVFDAARPIALQLRTSAGVKTIRVRFPSDEEWTERQRRRKVIIKQLGRGVSETIIANGEDADAALLAKIRVPEEGAPDVDAFEASRIMEQLSQAEVDDVAQAGDAFRVTLRVLGGAVAHVLRMPSAKDVIEDLRAALKLGIHLGLDDIRADEFSAMLILEDEREKLDREQMQNGRT